MDLVTGNTGQRALRGADLSGKVGESGEVVPMQGGRIGELGACKLHPVSGITGKTDHNRLQLIFNYAHLEEFVFIRIGKRN
jgi:hypothetical protein